jgi:Dolichyl-phosphate-mannose-protein mannosyltransferase
MPSTTRIVSSRSTNQDSASPQTLSHIELERATVVLLFLGCFGYLYIFRHFSSMEPDEGIVLQGANRILAGQVPYRDFFSFYTPGSFYLVAALFRVFGNSFVVARTSLAVAGAFCSVLTYLLARRVCSRGISVFAAILATVAGAAFRFLVLHNCYSTVFTCSAVYAAVRLVETRSSRWAFGIGSLAALTFLFEQSKGGGLALGLLLGFVVLRKSLFNQRSAAPALAVGVAWPFVVTFGYFAIEHAVHRMIISWLWPLRNYTAANHVPYDWQNWSDHSRDVIFRSGPMAMRIAKAIAVSPGFVIALLPLIALSFLVYWTTQLRRHPEVANPARYYITVCSACAGLLLSIVIVRPDILHFMYLAPLWYVVLAWVLGAPQRFSRLLNCIRSVLIAYAATAFGMLGFAVLLATTGAHNKVETRRGLVTTGQPDTVLQYLQAHTKPGETLLVYPYVPLYNYLTETRSPSRFDFFQPGMNTPEQAHEIIQSLKTTHARAVLFEPWFAEKFANSWPETPLGAIANDPVADYITCNFRVCQMLQSPDQWRFHFMVRKDLACP